MASLEELSDSVKYCATTLDDIPVATRAMAGMLYYERENGPGSVKKLFEEALNHCFSKNYNNTLDYL